ncbi:restriction endonuclease, partial [Lactobacillus sp. UMNPBX2]
SKNIRKLITKLVGSKKEGVSIYDPALGTASLLLGINRAALKENKYYGQEINTQVIKIAIMNAIINDVADDKFEFKNANTLANNWEFGKADIVVS